MKLAQINEAQYYKAKSFRTLLNFFEQIENVEHPELSGTAYQPKDEHLVLIVEVNNGARTFEETIIRMTTDRTGVWVDYKGGDNGDWTSEDYLAKNVQVHLLGNPSKNARRLF